MDKKDGGIGSWLWLIDPQWWAGTWTIVGQTAVASGCPPTLQPFRGVVQGPACWGACRQGKQKMEKIA